MMTDVVALHRNWTVEDALQFLRREVEDVDQPFYLYVVDEDDTLRGVVSLRSIVTSTPETPIAAITSEEVYSVRVDEDQEIAAERMRHYGVLALPVVDAGNHLRGVITIDRVLEVQVEEATEDMLLLAGLSDEERLFRPLREAVPPRLGWLSINLVTAFLAAGTVNVFEDTIAKVAMLAVFMPIVAGMGGNAGIQTITLVVRSIALGEIEVRDGKRVLEHEITIAVIKGVFLGIVTGLIALLWKGNAWLGLVVGIALVANIINATVAGVLVPLTLRRLKLDPALASGVIVTTFSDVMGFFVFLGLATVLISKLT
jgi:magnesium transporter